MRRNIALAALAASSAAAIGTDMHRRAAAFLSSTNELVGTRGVEQIAKDQAAVGERKRALRQSARDASNVLVEMGNRHLVLGHIHPRWLRQEVERRLDLGEDVDGARLAELRAAGPGEQA